MISATTESAVRLVLRKFLKNEKDRGLPIGIYASQPWTGPDRLDVDGRPFRIMTCETPLAVRLAMHQEDQDGESPRLALLTRLPTRELSQDILVRLERQKLQELKGWEIVLGELSCRVADPRLSQWPWMADVLLEAIDRGAGHTVPGGFLDADSAWEMVLEHLLGLQGAVHDLTSLLRWSAKPAALSRWRALASPVREGIRTWWASQAGQAATLAFGSYTESDGPEPLAVGLILEVLSEDHPDPETVRGLGRLEASLGVSSDSAHCLRQWADATGQAVGLLDRETRRAALDAAERFADQIGLQRALRTSSWLPGGLDGRIERYADALDVVVAAGDPGISEQLVKLADTVAEHHLAADPSRQGTLERIRLTLSLVRWLELQRENEASDGRGLEAAAREYVRSGSFVDLARRVAFAGDPHPALERAITKLEQRVRAVREKQNRLFAESWASQLAAGSCSGSLVPVRTLLADVVAPAAIAAPILLIVMDGMSFDVAREMLESILANHEWTEVAPKAAPERLIGLSTVPSVTEVARTALLTGRVATGNEAVEAVGFGNHQELREASSGNRPPLLFHKSGLMENDNAGLSGAVREAVADPRQRVVGVIVNAVDDQLSGGDQVQTRWSTQSVRGMEALLETAARSERLVIMTSDHGHCLERGSRFLDATEEAGGERWRAPSGAVRDGEIEVFSDVAMGGEKIIVPWSEQIRYTRSKSGGYHGGVSLQEMLTPILMFWSTPDLPTGYRELPPDKPLWFVEPHQATTPPTRAVEAVMEDSVSRKKMKAPDPVGPLFSSVESDQTHRGTPEPAARPRSTPEVRPMAAWISSLLESAVFEEQKQLAGRAVPSDAQIAELLAALDGHGNSLTIQALASLIRIPVRRFMPFMAMAQRVLNVEGYPVLTKDEASKTVRLNRDLLDTQFGLDGAHG